MSRSNRNRASSLRQREREALWPCEGGSEGQDGTGDGGKEGRTKGRGMEKGGKEGLEVTDRG